MASFAVSHEKIEQRRRKKAHASLLKMDWKPLQRRAGTGSGRIVHGIVEKAPPKVTLLPE